MPVKKAEKGYYYNYISAGPRAIEVIKRPNVVGVYLRLLDHDHEVYMTIYCDRQMVERLIKALEEALEW